MGGDDSTALVADKAELGQLIEDMIMDNSNNIRIVPEAERMANFLVEKQPSRKKKKRKVDDEVQKQNEAAFRAKSHEARLRRKALLSGMTMEDVRKRYDLIPNEHM